MAILEITIDRTTFQEISRKYIDIEQKPNYSALVDAYIGDFISLNQDTKDNIEGAD